MTSSIQSPKDPLLPPAANQLWVGDSWNNALGYAPSFAYKLQYNAHDGTDESPDTVVDLKYDNVSMTPDQWKNWSVNADDRAYILACLAENLGLQLA